MTPLQFLREHTEREAKAVLISFCIVMSLTLLFFAFLAGRHVERDRRFAEECSRMCPCSTETVTGGSK